MPELQRLCIPLAPKVTPLRSAKPFQVMARLTFQLCLGPARSQQTLPTSLQFRQSPPETPPKRNWKVRRRRLWWLELPPRKDYWAQGDLALVLVISGRLLPTFPIPTGPSVTSDWSEMSQNLVVTLVSDLPHQSMWPRWP
jgi:hypothetical protein